MFLPFTIPSAPAQQHLQFSRRWLVASMSQIHTQIPGGMFLAVPGPPAKRLTVSDGRILERFCGSFLPWVTAGAVQSFAHSNPEPGRTEGTPLAGFPWWSLASGEVRQPDLLCVCVLRQRVCCVFFQRGGSQLHLNRNTLCGLL